MAFPNNEIKWDWVSDVHVYIKSNAVIRLWHHCRVRTCHLRIKLSTVNVWYKQTHGQNGVVSTAGGVNFIVWPWYFSALSFHASYSIRSHFRKWFVSQNMEPLSLCSTSRGLLTARFKMNMHATRYFFPNALREIFVFLVMPLLFLFRIPPTYFGVLSNFLARFFFCTHFTLFTSCFLWLPRLFVSSLFSPKTLSCWTWIITISSGW